MMEHKGEFMKISKVDMLLVCFVIIEFGVCFLLLPQLTIFQFMLLGQVVPSVVLAILAGRLLAGSQYKWILLPLFAALYAFLMFALLQVVPFDVIENNTVQSSTSVFQFNREVQFGTYVGFFLQEFLMGAFAVMIAGIFRKIKQGSF